MKKLLSIIFTLVIFLISTLSFSVVAESTLNLSYTISEGEVTITGCGEDIRGEVTVPLTIEGCPVTAIDSFAFFECKEITKVNLPDSIKKIGNHAFYGCTKLTEITLPEGVNEIGTFAFSFCEGVEKITVSEGNRVFTSKGNCLIKIDGNEVILGCKNSVIPATVTKIGNGAFNGCTGLTSIVIPDNVTSIDALAFNNCKGLKNITLPQNIESIETSVFNTCTALRSITIPKSVKNISGSAFYYCTALMEINIPENVESIGDAAFFYCENLKSINISSKVKDIGQYVFYKCYSLESITVDENNSAFYAKGNCLIKKSNNSIILACNNSIIPAEAVSISYDSFACCTKIKSLYIPKNITKVYTSAFSGTSKLKTVNFEGTEEQWNNISIASSGNTPLLAATVIFNSVINYGDVNGDGTVNKKDDLALNKYLADITDDIVLTAADVFYDCAVNKKDLLHIKRHLAGQSVVLGK